MRKGGSVVPGPTGSPSPPDTTGPQGLLIGGSWVPTDRTFDVTNAFDGDGEPGGRGATEPPLRVDTIIASGTR